MTARKKRIAQKLRELPNKSVGNASYWAKPLRRMRVWRIWEKPEGKTGFQLTNNGPSLNKWLWFPTSRVLSYSVEPVAEAEVVQNG